MKKFLNSLSILAFLLVFTACEERERPFPEYDNIEHGAFARQLSRTGAFFLTDVANSAIDVSVEFYDDNQGKNVSSYSWTVRYIDKTGAGNNAGPVNILNIPASSFTTNASTGLPSASFSFRLADVLTALGRTAADVDGGSTLRFEATVTLNDGRTFTSANTDSNVQSSAPFAGLFRFDADLLCTSALAGVYEATTVGWCGNTGPTITVEWAATSSPGVYNVIDPADPTNPDAGDFSYGAYTACYGAGSTLPGGTLQVKDACNAISPIGASRWGEVYEFTAVSVNGSDLIIEWVNDYGEGGTTTLHRTDGTSWPPLTN